MTEDPVFILCSGRTGSTLLRLLLDCHPSLACPAEANLPALCSNMVPAWSLVTGNPVPIPNMPFDVSMLPHEVKQGLRSSMDLIISNHLARTGKSRWCDKSLGSARYAQLLLQVYPAAKFICLYRFPMDVVASALEACPYGLGGYGYDSYIAASPGNSVLAVARSWLETTAEIMTAEEDFGDHCLRIRYEDLVSDPETVMEGVFSFLSVPPVPDVVKRCFTTSAERLGMGDYKIWHTGRITAESVGRGWGVPATLIADPILNGINELCGRLGYVTIDSANWGIGPAPKKIRVIESESLVGAPIDAHSPELRDLALLIHQRLRAALAQMADKEIPPGWLAVSSDTVAITVVSDCWNRSASVEVVLNLSARSAEIRESPTWVPVGTDRGCALIGPAVTWREILTGERNLGVAIRLNQIRYAGPAAEWTLGDLRVAMISELLGLASWNSQGIEAQAMPSQGV